MDTHGCWWWSGVMRSATLRLEPYTMRVVGVGGCRVVVPLSPCMDMGQTVHRQ